MALKDGSAKGFVGVTVGFCAGSCGEGVVGEQADKEAGVFLLILLLQDMVAVRYGS